MSSRETILSAIKANQPAQVALPHIESFETKAEGSVTKFADALSSVGGEVVYVSEYEEIKQLIIAKHGQEMSIISPIKELTGISDRNLQSVISEHDLRDVEVAILKAHFGVAENGAVWIIEEDMGHRVLPFICQHIALVIDGKNIVPTMHDAYELIGKTTYGFGTFIAGPSKTADIEQSLVIGAHGPRSMTVFILQKH